MGTCIRAMSERRSQRHKGKTLQIHSHNCMNFTDRQINQLHMFQLFTQDYTLLYGCTIWLCYMACRPSLTSQLVTLKLSLQLLEQSNCISRKLSNTFGQLLSGHLVLVQQESKFGLIVNIRHFLQVQPRRSRSIQLLRH